MRLCNARMVPVSACLPESFSSCFGTADQIQGVWMLRKYSITQLHPSTILLFKNREERPPLVSISLLSSCFPFFLLRCSPAEESPQSYGAQLWLNFFSPVHSFWTVAGYFPAEKASSKGLWKLSLSNMKPQPYHSKPRPNFLPPQLCILAPVFCLCHLAPYTCYAGGILCTHAVHYGGY